MRAVVRPLLVKVTHLSTLWWQILLLLISGVILKSVALALWDAGSVSLFLSEKVFFHIGIDFMGTAVILSAAGTYAWVLERQKGYGSVGAVALCVLAATVSLFVFEKEHAFLAVDVFFILKYVFWLLLTTAFWSVAARFIAFRFDSLKFVVVFCAELIGFGLAGLITASSLLTPIGVLLTALFSMIGLTIVLKLLNRLCPIPKETFVKKTDGIRDVFERPLVLGILTLAFCCTAARALMDAVLYGVLYTHLTHYSPMVVLGLIWSLFGFIGLITVAALYHTRYIYTTLVGMLILGGGVIAAGVTGIRGETGFVATAYFIFLISSYFYLSGYLHILPRPLSFGIGPRLKKRRLTVAEPLGFVFAGIVLLNFNDRMPAVILTGLGLILILVIMGTVVLYSHLLFRMFKMRLWHGGPLMVAYPKLAGYLQLLLKRKSPDDVIYALRILETANHPGYESSLLKSLKHTDPPVRLFALKKMRKLYRFSSFQYIFESMLNKDRSQQVRNMALTNLILLGMENSSAPDPGSYLSYLDHKTLRCGAVAGFLKVGGDLALSAMDTLQKLARSKQIKDNMAALRLMAEAPSPAFVRLVDGLLKNQSSEVVRQALLTAGAMKNPLLLSAVFKALDDPELQEAALTALEMYGKAAFPPLEKMLTNPQTPMSRRKILILFLGALSSGEGKQILIRALTVENQKLRKTIIQNIIDSGIVWIHRDKKDILRHCLKKDMDRIAWLLHFREKYGSAPTHETEEAFGFLMRAIQEDIDDTRELILYQLLLMENNKMFVKAVRVLLGTTYDLYLPAMGMIQDLLPGRLYQKLKPILILPLAHKRMEMVSGLSDNEAVEGLSSIILNPPFVLNHWIRATALYALRRLGSEAGMPAAEAALTDMHPVVLEAAIWALVRLQPDKKELHRQLLKIPTSRLAGQSLDKILES